MQVCLQPVAFLATWVFHPVFSICLSNPCGVGNALEPTPLPWAVRLAWHPALHWHPALPYSPGLLLLCPESFCSLESCDGLLLCMGDHRALCWPEHKAGSSVLAFLKQICKDPCPCFLPVPLAVAAQHLEGCGWSPLSFTAARGFPPQLEAVGGKWLLELQKSCFAVMGCTPGAVTNSPDAATPSVPFSFIPFLPPWFSCSLIFCCSFLSLFPFGLLLSLLHTGKGSRERTKAEACYSRSFKAVV